MRALLSVYDKTGLVEFGKGLEGLGWDLIASGQTSGELGRAGIAHSQVADVTGSPEMLGGRVKTLHPHIFAGILADRSLPSHMEDLEANGIEKIDLVVSNLYPFSSDPSIELIDIGGPAMVRAAAKNFAHVGILTSPLDYPLVLEELNAKGTLSDQTRKRLARIAFAHTATYDAAIVSWFDETCDAKVGVSGKTGDQEDSIEFPPSIHVSLERRDVLRYGENPHQQGARYRVSGTKTWWDEVTQHSGTPLSYLNVFDTDAAWRLVHELGTKTRAGVAIIKHANPCGAAIAGDLASAYEKALSCDEMSAFGGIVAISGQVDGALAEVIASGPQADVIIASGFDEKAIERLRTKRKATRLLSAPVPEPIERQMRAFGKTFLVQSPDLFDRARMTWRVATTVIPTDEQWSDIELAWRVCARTTSNAIALVCNGQAVGVGAGQQSRVVAAEIACSKAGDRAKGGSAASDAFFPFKDGLEVLIDAGVSAVIQPGGSVRDDEITQVANDAGIAMVMTSERHFRH